jgi:tetratricopeptide (TPR) repeat protein
MLAPFGLAVLWLVSSAMVLSPVQDEIGRDGLPLGAARHTLYGDLKVEGLDQAALTRTFSVVLERAGGQVFGRVPLPPGGRYRFNAVPNGEYLLVVELDNDEVYRDQFILYEGRSTEIRRDIELMWRSGQEEAVPQTIYARSADNRRRFENATAALKSGDLKRAATLLAEVVGSDAADFEAWTELGTVEFQRERESEAQQAYGRALALQPDYFPALLNLGKLHLGGKRYEQAIAPLERAVQLVPGHAEANHLLGEAFLGIKKGSKAVPYLETAIRLDPQGMADVHLRLAQLYDRAGMKDRAAREYREYLRKRPDSPRRSELERYIAANR